MQQLNLPKFDFRFKKNDENTFIFDIIRKKFVVLSPEEWVRQNVVCYLIFQKKYPKSSISVEKIIKINLVSKRYDIVVFNNTGSVKILVECKSPEITISQITFDQIARYNLALKADFLMVTNGLHHYYCKIENNNYSFLENLPDYKS